MSRISSGIGISASSLTSWRINAIGKRGARSSGPTGSPVPGCSTGNGRVGMSATTLYQRRGICESSSRYFVCSTGRQYSDRGLQAVQRERVLAQDQPRVHLVGEHDGERVAPPRRGEQEELGRPGRV